MKTKLLTLIAFAFLAHTAVAQISIGVKAGANISKIDGKSFKDEFRYGYHLGGFAEIGLGGNFAIQPEVLFNQYNTKVDSNFSHIYQNAFSSATNNEIKLNYLSIPLLVNFKLIGNTLVLQAGPQFGILLDKNQNLLQNGEQAFKNGDFSMLGGAQLRFSKFRLTGRYAVGLNNINDIDNQDEWKNQVLQFSLGIGL